MKFTQTITTTIEIEEEHLVNLLANAFADYMWIGFIDWNDDDYRVAKDSLLAEGKEDKDLCREDVWARMLMLNKALILEDEDEERYKLKIENIAKQNVDWEWLEDNGDFYDNDAIIQKAVFGEVIYG